MGSLSEIIRGVLSLIHIYQEQHLSTKKHKFSGNGTDLIHGDPCTPLTLTGVELR